MQKYNWNYPTTMWVGENRINDIAEACKNLGITKPLLVTDKGLAETNIVKNTLSILDSNKVPQTLLATQLVKMLTKVLRVIKKMIVMVSLPLVVEVGWMLEKL